MQDGSAFHQQVGNVLPQHLSFIKGLDVVSVGGKQEQVGPGRFRGKLRNHPAGLLGLCPDQGVRIGFHAGLSAAITTFRQKAYGVFPIRFPQAGPLAGIQQPGLQNLDPSDRKGVTDLRHTCKTLSFT